MSASQHQDCPSFETLSAWYDGEEKDTRLNAHVKRCEACQQIVQDFELFDHEIASHIEAIAPSSSTIQRMIRQTRYRLKPKTIKLLPMPILWRTAACVALLFAVFSLYQRLQRQGLEDQGPSVATVAGEAEDNPDELSAFEQKLIADLIEEFGDSAEDFEVSAPSEGPALPPTTMAAQSVTKGSTGVRQTEVSSDGVLQLNDISFVGYGAPRQADLDRNKEAMTTREPQLLADNVRHVWLVDDATAPLKALQALMPAHKQDFAELIAQNRDEYVLQFVVRDRDLQELVNHFDALAYKLISPNHPQPGHDDKVRLIGKQVQYEVDFVRK